MFSAGRAEDGAAELVDVGDGLRSEVDGGRAEFGKEAAIAVQESVDLGHAIAKEEFEGESADDVVETGTEAAAGDDGCAGFCGIEEDLAAGAGGLEDGKVGGGAIAGGGGGELVVEEDAVGFVDVVDGLQALVEGLSKGRVDEGRP